MEAATPEASDSKRSELTAVYQNDGLRRILSLDGGGAKGFYTLGVIKEIDGMLKCPLCKRFDLVFGTSTGAIIASLINFAATISLTASTIRVMTKVSVFTVHLASESPTTLSSTQKI